MTDVLAALVLGVAVGVIFALFRLDVPAPATLAGVAGIVGLWAGWTVVGHMLERGRP